MLFSSGWHTFCNTLCTRLTGYYIWGGDNMNCPKCKGRMFTEKFYDFVRSFDAWKCTCCGEVIDPTILANRARNQSLFLG